MAWRSSQALLQRESSSKIWARAPLLSRGVTTCNSPPTTTQDTSDVLLQTKNGEAIFAGLSTKELIRTLFNLHLVAYEPMVDLSLKVLTSPMMRYALFQVPVNQVVKRTAYSHFCAGENVEEASRTLQRMWELGLRGILDYSSEDATDNKSCDKNLEKFIQVVQQTNQLPQGSVSTSCVKISAICPIQLLERVSNLLRWQHMHKEFKLPWKQDVIPFLAAESPTYHVTSPPDPLTKDEETDLALAHERLSKLCKTCEQEGLPLLIDAEYSSVQPAIDYIIYVAAAEFNKGSWPLIYGTMQAYLKDSFSRLQFAVKGSHERGLSYGVKLVRGAYITRENELASSLRAPSPIHSNIDGTHRCYDSCATFMLEQAANGDGAVVLATHNMDSGRKAAAKAQELGLSRRDPRVQFAQLKGMADMLSLSLAHAGFRVSKYLPFGPVPEVIPYLVRRAEENRGLLGNTVHERQAIRAELRRRLLQA
ncbi:hypothetical protein M758_5G183700 [Ceratodon purpureus]|nr:hypothetical protein M758_5G183700 [Ceratodon purpureus]